MLVPQKESYNKPSSTYTHSVMSDSDAMGHSPSGSCPWGFLGKNTRVGCYFPLQGNLSNPETKFMSPASPALAGRFFTTEAPWKPT